MLSGVAAGIMYHDNEVYLTAAPNVYRLRDKDGDGDADEREVISHGFGIHIAYAGHDMSGLIMGPDGKVYWSIGDIGVNAMDKQGNRYAYPNQGAVMRCNPDGTDFEVYAHGLRNPQELAFDAYGNLISVDNDGDHPGEHERFVHILEGSDTGWRINWQFGKYHLPNEDYKVWIDEKLHLPHFPGQASYILPPLALAPNGPVGLVYQPGSALNDKWKDYFFGSYFTGSSASSQIQAFRLQPKGASFRLAETKDILSGIVSTGLAFGPDGALYINDWLDGYALKEAGRIWRLDVHEKNADKRKQTQALLKGGMQQQSILELKLLLGYEDMRVRLNAQFELVKRNEKDALLSVLETQNHELAQIHAIWGMGQLVRNNATIGAELVPLLKSENPEIRAQTAKVLGDAKYRPAANGLLDLLKDDSDRAKYFAAEALGKLADPRAFQPLVNLLDGIEDSDPHFRHGLMYALFRLGMEKEMVALSDHSSIYVRLGAIVALRNMRSTGLKSFLQDTDSLVVIEAARAIHDDQSVPEALPALAKALLTQKITDEAFVRRAINANLRIGDAASADRLATYAARTAASVEMRKDALWALGFWPNPPLLDRVEGRYRKLSNHEATDALQAFSKIVAEMLNSKNNIIRIAAVEAVGRIGYQPADDQLISYCLEKDGSLEMRRAALQSLADLKSASIAKVLKACLSAKELELRTDAQVILGSSGLPDETVVSMLDQVLDKASIPEQQNALNSLSAIEVPAAHKLLSDWLEKLISGRIDPSLQLDVSMAVRNSSYPDLKQQLASFDSLRVSESNLQGYEETLYGGNLKMGKRVFINNSSAQCMRCHTLEGYGGAVGPDLTGIASVLDRESLLEALIDPSARLAAGFGTISLELKDGSKVVGILEQESDGVVTVQLADSSRQEFDYQKIQKKVYSPSSMPSIMGVLSKQEIRDLIAFLADQR